VAKKTLIAGSLLLVLLASFAGCADEGQADGNSTSEKAFLEDGLPSGHPPLDGTGGLKLVWQVPEGWKIESPETTMRVAQYRITGSAGDALCVVFYFGAGEGGDPEANALRWASQFEQPDGISSAEKMTMTTLEGTEVPLHLVEVTGTYHGGMAMADQPVERRPNFMLLGAIAEGPEAPWFFKLTGPEATVRSQREPFVRMLESIHLED
jgi:hypothetical protein